MNRFEILGLKKAAIVLKTLADTFKDHSARLETLVLVECIVKAANELESKNLVNGDASFLNDIVAEDAATRKDVVVANSDLVSSPTKTLRDEFAIAALTGEWASNASQESFDDCAKLYYRMADAMLKERETIL